MLYAKYIFPPEKKEKRKRVEEDIVEAKPKTVRLKKHFGLAPQASDLSTEERLLRAEAHLIELQNKIKRLTDENTALQDYLDERPDQYFDVYKMNCLAQNEDLYNWEGFYEKLVQDFEKMPEILKEKQENLDNLKAQHLELTTQYEDLEKREQLTTELKDTAAECNREMEKKMSKIREMQGKLAWMEDYHRIQLNGEMVAVKREQKKQRFALNYYKKLCEEIEMNAESQDEIKKR